MLRLKDSGIGTYPFLFSHIYEETMGKDVLQLAYEEKRIRSDLGHRLSLDERERLIVSGVEDVESFDENTIVMDTVKGTLIVRGNGLHIDKLSLDGGELSVEGTVDALLYEDQRRDSGGLFSRLFR